MISLILFGAGALLLFLALVLHFVERKQARQWFLSGSYQESRDFLDNRRQVFSRMGWEISRLQFVFGTLLIMLFMAALPRFFHELWMLSGIFAALGLVAVELGIRLYALRFNIRFENGLRTSALEIGIEALMATGEATNAMRDILHQSRDKVILREFKAIQSVMNTLHIPCEEAMVIRADELKVPAYVWLAHYTLKLRQSGANTGEAWQDVLEELEDRDTFRTRVMSKTSSIRKGAYGFGIALGIALLLFFRRLIPLMTGMMPVIFGVIMISVAIGIYRQSRLGGDVK